MVVGSFENDACPDVVVSFQIGDGFPNFKYTEVINCTKLFRFCKIFQLFMTHFEIWANLFQVLQLILVQM